MAQSKKGRTSPKAARRKARKLAGEADIREKKVFTYRGYTIEELREMPLEEFKDLLPSKQRRNIDRGFTASQERFLNHLRRTDGIVRTHRRDMMVLPEMVGRAIAIHNGKEFFEVSITPEMLGHNLGELSLTRKAGTHTGPGVGATKSSKFMPLK